MHPYYQLRAITLDFQLCSACYTILQIKNITKVSTPYLSIALQLEAEMFYKAGGWWYTTDL